MSCDSEIAKEWPASKDPDDAKPYYVDFRRYLARLWEAGKQYGLTDRIQPMRANGFEFECSSAGQSAANEPKVWPTTIGATVTDGSIIWTCRALSTASLETTISGTPTWTPDSGLTVGSTAIAGTVASATLSGGSDANDYVVLVKATFANGTTKTATCVLRVRRPVRTCDA